MSATSARSGGQAMTEFLLVCAALLVALFFPYVEGHSVVFLLLRALLQCFQSDSFLVSIL